MECPDPIVSDKSDKSNFLNRLSNNPSKRDLLLEDLYFRETWSYISELEIYSTEKFISNVALLMLKPDAVVARRLSDILNFVISHGFTLQAAQCSRLSRHSMRELWRYDWHVYPVDRLRFCDIWYQAADVVILLLEDNRADGVLPASARLSRLKGDSLASKRNPESLRSVLQPPNQILNYVHVADEPIDVVREIGILLDPVSRRRLLDKADGSVVPERQAIASISENVNRSSPTHDLDFSASLRRLVEAGRLTLSAKGELKSYYSSGSKVSLDQLNSMIKPDQSASGTWDFITVASALITLERAVIPPLGWASYR